MLKSGSRETFCSAIFPCPLAGGLCTDPLPAFLTPCHPPAIEKRKTKVNFPPPTQIFLAGVAGIQAPEPEGDWACRKPSSPSAPGTHPGDPGDRGGLGWSCPSHSAGAGDGTAVKKWGAPPGQPWGPRVARPQGSYRAGVGFAPMPELWSPFSHVVPDHITAQHLVFVITKGCESCPQHRGGSRVSPRSGSGWLSLRQDPALQTCSPQLRSQDRLRPFAK